MSKVQSFMKFAFLRLIELFYLYVFPIPTPRGINAVSLIRKLKDSVGSQRALLKKASTLACQELLLHSLQKQPETTLKSLRHWAVSDRWEDPSPAQRVKVKLSPLVPTSTARAASHHFQRVTRTVGVAAA